MSTGGAPPLRAASAAAQAVRVQAAWQKQATQAGRPQVPVATGNRRPVTRCGKATAVPVPARAAQPRFRLQPGSN